MLNLQGCMHVQRDLRKQREGTGYQNEVETEVETHRPGPYRSGPGPPCSLLLSREADAATVRQPVLQKLL